MCLTSRLCLSTYKKLVKTQKPIGFVIIDDDRFPISIGGIRLINGVSEHEVELLAKSMSLKLHSFGFPMSGAKGGVNSDDINDFFSFIRTPEIKELIDGKQKQFITGPDIGTSEEEYYKALELADLSHLIRKGLLSGISKKYGLVMDNIVTAWGAVVAMEEVMRDRNSIDPLKDMRITLEGFGKVGTGIAKILSNRAKIVGISTKYGSIQAEEGSKYVHGEGFKVEDLLELQSKYGDNFINHCGVEVKPTSALFSIPTDIVVPGARTESITIEVATNLMQSGVIAIVPVSNYPYTDGALTTLIENKIICFPDFIASAGAVIAAMVEFADVGGQQEALDLVEAAIRQESRELLKIDKFNVYRIAREKAETRKVSLLQDVANYSSIKDLAKSIIYKYKPDLL